MALFSKPPAKKPDPAKPAVQPGVARADLARAPPSAREAAAAHQNRAAAVGKLRAAEEAAAAKDRDITVTGPSSLIEWTPGGQPSIQVGEANPGLCAVLENAALLYANGQAAQALQLLADGVANDNDAKVSPLAWLALFDLMQRAGDRAGFDQLALQYVVAFERSAPPWEEQGTRLRAGARPISGGYVGLTGKLSAANAPQIATLLAACQKQAQVRLDVGSLTGADDAGAKLLADALAQLRRRQYALTLQHPEKIRAALENSVKKGREAGEGYWILLLEMLQWQHDHQIFEDRAVEFAVAFEVSPPSWEPPPVPVGAAADPATPAGAENVDVSGTLVWTGVMTGSSDKQLVRFAEFREGRNLIPIDMSGLDRIDFVCAGALLNVITRAEAQRKKAQIVGASPIIRALLLLIGISPRHFIRKAQ